MSLSNPFATKTAGVSTLPASEVNAAGAAIAKAVDGTGGGTYSPTAKIIVDGSYGIQVNGSGAASHYQVSSRSITRVVTTPMIERVGGSVTEGDADVGTGDDWTQALLVPHGATITAVTAYINPADDALPTTKAIASLVRLDVTTGATSGISALEDPNTGAAYQAHHGFGPSGLSEVVDRTKYKYYVDMTPEVGGDFDIYVWCGTTVTYTVTNVDEGY